MFPRELEFYQRRANVFCERVKDEIYSDRSSLRCEYAATKDPVEFKKRLEPVSYTHLTLPTNAFV